MLGDKRLEMPKTDEMNKKFKNYLVKESKKYLLLSNGFQYNKEREQWNAWINNRRYDIDEELVKEYSYEGLEIFLLEFTGHASEYNFYNSRG